ncbi:hypothetical protein HBI76_158230 [Parastagonospora nodorum]|nr:hypothetical protein HBI76_158230 [Parastagonospora nodorum]
MISKMPKKATKDTKRGKLAFHGTKMLIGRHSTSNEELWAAIEPIASSKDDCKRFKHWITPYHNKECTGTVASLNDVNLKTVPVELRTLTHRMLRWLALVVWEKKGGFELAKGGEEAEQQNDINKKCSIMDALQEQEELQGPQATGAAIVQEQAEENSSSAKPVARGKQYSSKRHKTSAHAKDESEDDSEGDGVCTIKELRQMLLIYSQRIEERFG